METPNDGGALTVLEQNRSGLTPATTVSSSPNLTLSGSITVGNVQTAASASTNYRLYMR